MGSITITVRYRPLRIGWCVDGDNLADFERAVRLSHACWGGRYNPIIPCAEPEMASALVSAFEVDTLYAVSNTAVVSYFIKQFPHLPWPGFRPELVNIDNATAYMSVLDVVHPVRHVHDEHVKGKDTPTVDSCLYEWSDGDPLRYVFLTTLGGYPSKDVLGRDYSDLFKRGLKPKVFAISESDELPANAFRQLTPTLLSGFDLEELEPHFSSWREPGFYLGNASDFTDLVTYWNLRACNIDLLFYDKTHGPRLDSLRVAFSELFQERPKRDPWQNHLKVWKKTGDLDATPFDGKFTLATMSPGLFDGLNLNPPSMGFNAQSVLGNSSQDEGGSSVTFQLPSKPFFTDDFVFHDQKMVVSISALGPMRSASLFTPPFIPQLNEYYGRRAYFDNDKARAERGSLGIICTVTKEQLTLRALPFPEIISRAFQAFGMKTTPSAAGLVGLRLIDQMGGLQGCSVFKIEGVRTLIRDHSSTKVFDRSLAIRTIGNNDPVSGHPRFDAFKKLYIEPRERSELKPEDAFIYLLKKGVFHVGITFECPVCQLDFWLSLDDVKSHVKCLYCTKEFNVLPQLRDRNWAYRRSGLFGRDDHQKGGIPVSLVLQQLETALYGSLACYTTAMDIESQGATVPKCETDFVAIIRSDLRDNRRLHLLIGECKDRGGEITRNDADNLRTVAEAFNDSPFSVYILFAKAGVFTADEIENCKAARRTIGDRVMDNVILLSQRELEPYLMYARTLADMAQNTRNIFFDPLLKG